MRAETTLERWQQVHDLRGKGAGLLECARRLGLSLNTVKRYDRASEPGRLQRVPKYRPTLVDPYRDYLRKRRAEEPGVPDQQLLREIRERGYQGSSNLLVRYINQGRLDGSQPHLSPRRAARLLLTRPERLAGGQQETVSRVEAACPEMTALAALIRDFAALLAPGFQLPGEAFDVGAADAEQGQGASAAPAGELAQVQRVRLAGQPTVSGQEPGEGEPFGIGESGLDSSESSGWGSSGHRAPPGRAETREAGPAAGPSD